MKILYFASNKKLDEVLNTLNEFKLLCADERIVSASVPASLNSNQAWLYLVLDGKKGTKATRCTKVPWDRKEQTEGRKLFEQDFSIAVEFGHLFSDLYVLPEDSLPRILGAILLVLNAETGRYQFSGPFIPNELVTANLSDEEQRLFEEEKDALESIDCPGELFKDMPKEKLKLHSKRLAFFTSGINKAASFKDIMGGVHDKEIKKMNLAQEIIQLKRISPNVSFFDTQRYNDGFPLEEIGPVSLPDTNQLLPHEKSFIEALLQRAKEHIRVIKMEEKDNAREIYIISTLHRSSKEILSELFKSVGLKFSKPHESGFDFQITADENKLTTVVNRLKEDASISTDEMAKSAFVLRR